MGDGWGKDVAARASGSSLPGGAALSDHTTSRAWVLIDDGEVARFGGGLAWAWRAEASNVQVFVHEIVPGAAGVIARRAAQFDPAPAVFTVHERELHPAEPAPPPPSTSTDPVAVGTFADLLAAHGAAPVFEHGVLRGEVLGLEVARVVDGRLQVGVGRHDRWARAEMKPDEDLGAALDEAVAAVRDRRRAGAGSHPANTLARGRWLRAVLCARPSLVGAVDLQPVEPPLPWFDLPEAAAAPALGTAADSGGPVVVVCSVGIDLDLVPTAADARCLHAWPDTELVVVVPEGDDPPVLRALAERLRVPARVQTVPRGWEDLAAV